MTHRLEPETLHRDDDGIPWSRRYLDRYTSCAGGAAQARHVFIAGSDLPAAWAGRRQFVVLETGFGLGTNFLATWQAWRDDAQRPRHLHFVALELHPLGGSDLAGYGDGADPALRRLLAAQWPLPLPGLHRLRFDDDRVVLTLGFGDARALLAQLTAGVDAFYLDGFAPDRNPAMWDVPLFKALARLARPGATVATWTAARAVRTALAANGFAMQRRPGFAPKRDMLVGRYAPRWRMRRHEPPAADAGARNAIIVGAGLAGTSCALALCRRGWHVTLLERGAAAAAGASALPAGLLYPLLSADDNLAARLSRAAFLQARAALEALGAPARATVWQPCGVFQQAASPAAGAALRDLLARTGWPAQFAAFQTAADAAGHLGAAPRRDGLWFAGGAVVHAGRWCSAMLAAAQDHGGQLTAEYGFAAAQLHFVPATNGWELHATDGRRRSATVVILANAGALPALLPGQDLPLQTLPGQLTLLAPPALAGLRAAVGGAGYCIPPLLGPAAVGATYDAGIDAAAAPPIADPALAADAANLQRLRALLASAPAAAAAGRFAGLRSAAPDRFALAGAIVDAAALLADPQRHAGAHLADLPRLPGLYCVAALGSRGLTLAAILAEQVAAQICGEPQPLERDLAAAVDPARFVLRRMRGRYGAGTVPSAIAAREVRGTVR